MLLFPKNFAELWGLRPLQVTARGLRPRAPFSTPMARWLILLCIECPIVLCRCYFGVFVIGRTAFWFALLFIVLAIVFAEVLIVVVCLSSWGILGK